MPHASNWITHAMAFHLLFMKSDRFLSLAPDRKTLNNFYCVWPVRLAQITFAGIYFTAGLSKLPDPGWVSGTAFKDTLIHPIFSNFDFTWVPSFQPALKMINYAITTFEIGVPFLLILKKTRTLTVISLLLFHLGIDATIKVGWFALFATAYLMIFIDDLSFKFLNKTIPDRKHVLKVSWAARAFICFHLIAFSISHFSYFVKAVRNDDLGRIPLFSTYSSLAGIQEFRVWPTGFFLNPVKFLFLEAVHPDGTLEPIPPYTKSGAYRPGLLLVRQARPGLLVFRIASFGITEKKWRAFVQYLLSHYQSIYGKACPRELRISLIRDSLENFRGAPKKMGVEKPLILTAEMNCGEARPSFDLLFTKFGKSFIAQE